jgi:trimeric autotransporter adhesin
MNHIYRVIWNSATHSWVAVSELNSAKGKLSTGGKGPSTGRSFMLKAMALALVAAVTCGAGAPLFAQTIPGSNTYDGNANNGTMGNGTQGGGTSGGTVINSFYGGAQANMASQKAYGYNFTASSNPEMSGASWAEANTCGTINSGSNCQVYWGANYGVSKSPATGLLTPVENLATSIVNFNTGMVSNVDTLVTGVAPGMISVKSNDVVNGSELYSNAVNTAAALGGGSAVSVDGKGTISAPSYALTNANAIDGTTGAATNVGMGFAKVDAALGVLQASGNLVQQSAPGANITVAAATDGAAVDVTGTAGTRKVTGVTSGDLSASSVDAVNGSQLYATNQQVSTNTSNIATNTTNIAGNTTNIAGNTTAITNLTNNINSGTVGLVQQAAPGANITVAAATDGTLVDMTGTAGTRTVTGVTAGDLSASSVDAVNGSQLYATNQQVSTNTTNIAGNTSDITNLTNNINSGTVGLVQQTAPGANITVAAATDGAVVDMTGTAGTRTVTGVTAGAVNLASVDAINGTQLFGVSQSIANVIGGGSVVNSDGTITNPTYNVGGNTVNTIGGAITNIDGRVTQNTTDITDLTTHINNGSTGLVLQDPTTGDLTVAAALDGTVVNMSGTAGARTITGVAAGALNATSVDAVNGSQLYATNQQVSTNTTNIAGNTSAISNLTNNINGGKVGLVQQAAPGANITVAAGTDGTVVDMTGTSGTRTVTGVTAGALNATSVDAVNGSQLYATNQQVAANTSSISNIQSDISNISNGKVGAFQVSTDRSGSAPVANGTNSAAGGANAAASGANSVAVGNDSTASGTSSTVVGSSARATGANSVAIGAGSLANKANTVSVGSVGSERQVANVAAGTQQTDAVNLSQLTGVANAIGGGATIDNAGNVVAPSYSVGGNTYGNVGAALGNLDSRLNDNFNQLSNEINQNAHQANRGIAGAAALVQATPYMPGRTMLNAGVASYRGESALGVGVSRWSTNGRVNVNAGVSAALHDQPIFRVGVGVVLGD